MTTRKGFLAAVLSLVGALLAAVGIERYAFSLAEQDLAAALGSGRLRTTAVVLCGPDRAKCDLSRTAESRGGLIAAACVDTIPPFSYAVFECRAQFKDGSEVGADVWVRPWRGEIYVASDPPPAAG